MLDSDTIVIGSGSGGLTAAVALAQAGERVLVLEQHEVPGGWCHSFTRGGYHYSPGVHYIGQLESGASTAKIYEGLGVADDLAFFELNPDAFEQCTVSGEKFSYCRDADLLTERFQRRFPADAKGIGDFFWLVRQVYDQIPLIQDVKTFTDFLTIPYHTRHLGKFGLRSLQSIFKARVRDPLARALLAIQAGDHGLPPALAPFALHCGVMGHYFNGGYYPMGGGISLPLAMRKSLKKHGGEIRLNSRVRKILIENRRAIGVELASGETLRARRVISNADPGQTFNHMVGRDNLSRGLKRKLDRTRYSLPSVSLFFAIDRDPREFGMDSGNIWYYKDADLNASYARSVAPGIFDQDEFEGLFVTALSLKDPTQFDGRHHTLEAVTFTGYEAFRAFAGSGPASRSPEYARFKEKLQRMMIRTLDRAVPGLSKHIVFSELGTPNTNAHFVNATEGACYGTEKSRFQMGPFSYGHRTEIGELFLCGASTSAHGVSGAAHSGLNAAATALKCDRKELLRDKIQKLRTYPAENPAAWPEAIKEKISRRQRAHVTAHPSPPLA